MTAYIKNYLPDFEFPSRFSSRLDDHLVYTCEMKEIQALPITEFMAFTLPSARAEENRFPYTNVLETSFERSLTASGESVLDWLKVNILVRFIEWMDQEVLAPVADLSQGSGSGKSKLSVELTKDGPGFYLTLGKLYSIVYPLSNPLSIKFASFAAESDLHVDLRSTHYAMTYVGQTLMLLAQIITVYLRDWFTFTVDVVGRRDIRGSNDVLSLARAACSELGNMLGTGKGIDYNAFMRGNITEFITKAANGFTVKDVSEYIKTILDDPRKALDEVGVTEASIAVIKAMTTCLQAFPFIFILDDADQLNDQANLRRALSYIALDTRIFFLTLGKKSTVRESNPKPRDDVKRYATRSKLLKPIVLVSNTSVFSKDQYPLKDLKLSPKVLKNPLFFKFLVTLGHPSWAACPFESVVRMAEVKLLNGSSENYNNVLVLWMIRAGLMANPLDMNTRSMVATQMATLFNLSDDLTRMVAFYPSEPILALACRNLTSALTAVNVNQDHLFKKLEELFDSFRADRGQLSEIVGTMVILRAIDCSPNVASFPRIQDDLIEALEAELGEFNGLWRKKKFISESDTDDSCASASSTFQQYHVTTAANFLSKLLPPGAFDQIVSELPKSTLDGLVNASHAVKLFRTRNGFDFNGSRLKTMNLQTADDRIADKNCNLIDSHLLELGLIHQCCFLMPDRYHGFDLIVPVLLPSGAFTFIGIQFKAADVSINTSIEKMPARFHFVKCPFEQEEEARSGRRQASTQAPRHSCSICTNSPCPEVASPAHKADNCTHCTRQSALNEVFNIQICLLINLDPQDSKSFKSGTSSSLDKTDENYAVAEAALMNALSGDGPILDESSFSLRTMKFRKPLLSVRRTLPDNRKIALIKNIWDDRFVSLKQLKVTAKDDEDEDDDDRTPVIPFVKDGFVHRQYCIGISEIDSFGHLFPPVDSMKNAKSLISGETDFFKLFLVRLDSQRSVNNRERRQLLMDKLSYLKSIFHDASLNYPDASHVLAAKRQLQVGHQQLREAEMKFLKQEIESAYKTPSGSYSEYWQLGKPKLQLLPAELALAKQKMIMRLGAKDDVDPVLKYVEHVLHKGTFD